MRPIGEVWRVGRLWSVVIVDDVLGYQLGDLLGKVIGQVFTYDERIGVTYQSKYYADEPLVFEAKHVRLASSVDEWLGAQEPKVWTGGQAAWTAN